jgi:ribosomal protein S28E/S33
VRVFPLLNLAQARSPYIDEVCSILVKEGISSEIIQVDYELQKGGNQAIIFRQ